MHTSCPLKCHNDNFEPRQKVERESDTSKPKDGKHHPRVGSIRHKDMQKQRSHEMAYDQNSQIGWSIICSVMIKLLSTFATCVGDFKIALHHATFAATGTSSPPTMSYSGKGVSGVYLGLCHIIGLFTVLFHFDLNLMSCLGQRETSH